MANVGRSTRSSGKMGLMACTALIVGGMIGSSIFSISGLTMYYAGPSAIISWILAAIIMVMYGLVITELAAFFPKSGGIFVFPSMSLGRNERQGKVFGWFSAWGNYSSYIGAISFASVYVGTYVGASFPSFQNKKVILALCSILFCLALNMIGTSFMSKINTTLVFFLLATMMVYVVTVFTSGKWDASLLTPFFSQGSKGSWGFITAVINAKLGYGAITSIAFLVSEVENPEKDVPRSMVIGMTLVVSIYTIMILATMGLISASFLRENPGMRFIPMFAACYTVLSHIPWLSKVITVAAVLALLTTIITQIAISSRVIAATAEGGMLPKRVAAKNKNGVPTIAVLIIVTPCTIVACFPQFAEIFTNLGAIFQTITMTLNTVSLIMARKKFADREIYFRVPGKDVFPFITLALLYLCFVPNIIRGGFPLFVFTIIWYSIGALGLIYYFSHNKVGDKGK